MDSTADSQHADSPTFILNNNSSLLSGNNVLSNLQVIVDLLGWFTGPCTRRS